MKIALLGYGKMGKEIHQTILNRGHSVGFIHDSDAAFTSNPDFLSCDLAIEFTQPESALNNILSCLKAGKPVVSGTTGWMNDLEELYSLAEKYHGALFYASNFSPGIFIMRKLTEEAARLLNQFPDYEISLSEKHHIHKKDKPSGTAISLAEDFLSQHHNFKTWTLDTSPKQSELKVEAIREEEVVGDHVWKFESVFDTIEIKHSAKNRNGFALGAVLAAEFLLGKKGVFGMKNLWELK
jgi:4-hydroxy-tetrahydrodipicolinate reductase